MLCALKGAPSCLLTQSRFGLEHFSFDVVWARLVSNTFTQTFHLCDLGKKLQKIISTPLVFNSFKALACAIGMEKKR